eukprot:Amastigsp_a841637_477.p1 type:complete len:373 gc:universal Amastigsp_a841637_477:230-1348(+)
MAHHDGTAAFWLDNDAYAALALDASSSSPSSTRGFEVLDYWPSCFEEHEGRIVILRNAKSSRRKHPIAWNSPRGWKQLFGHRVEVQYRTRSDGFYKYRAFRELSNKSIVLLHVVHEAALFKPRAASKADEAHASVHTGLECFPRPSFGVLESSLPASRFGAQGCEPNAPSFASMFASSCTGTGGELPSSMIPNSGPLSECVSSSGPPWPMHPSLVFTADSSTRTSWPQPHCTVECAPSSPMALSTQLAVLCDVQLPWTPTAAAAQNLDFCTPHPQSLCDNTNIWEHQQHPQQSQNPPQNCNLYSTLLGDVWLPSDVGAEAVPAAGPARGLNRGDFEQTFNCSMELVTPLGSSAESPFFSQRRSGSGANWPDE